MLAEPCGFLAERFDSLPQGFGAGPLRGGHLAVGARVLARPQPFDVAAHFRLAVKPAAMHGRCLGDGGESDGLTAAVEAA